MGLGAPHQALWGDRVDVLAMPDRQDPNFVARDPVNDAVISYPELPVPLEPMSERLAIIARLSDESLFNRPADSLREFPIDSR
jgi:hypothetical protein